MNPPGWVGWRGASARLLSNGFWPLGGLDGGRIGRRDNVCLSAILDEAPGLRRPDPT